jgi:hypothetical protein
MQRNYKCQNCECYHQASYNALIGFQEDKPVYELGNPESVCEDCIRLPKFENNVLGCCKYQPRYITNLEFLEWKYNESDKSI